jgi:hypothetical protein
MERSLGRKIVRGTILFLLAVMILFAVGTYFLLQNKDNITRIVVGQLNAHLTTQVHSGSIEISLFKKIPYVAIEFNDVWAPAPDFDPVNDTLFSLKKVYVLMNIIKVIKGEYDVNRLLLQNGSVNMYISPQGQHSYQIWKKSAHPGPKGYKANLNDISLEQVKISYLNRPSKLDMAIDFKQLKLNGDINHDQTAIKLKSQMFIGHISHGKMKYVREGNAQCELALYKNAEQFRITDGQIKVNNQRIKVSGTMDQASGKMELGFNGQNVHYDSDQNIFNLSSKITSYVHIYGTVDLLASVTGNYKTKGQTNINSQFALKNGHLKFKNAHLQYRLHAFSGSFNSNPKKNQERFHVDQVYFTGNGDTLNGSFEITAFESPVLKFEANSSVHAPTLNGFFKSTANKVVFTGGKVGVNGRVGPVKLAEKDLWKVMLRKAENVAFTTRQLSAEFPSANKTLENTNIQGKLNTSLTLEKCSGFLQEMDFTLEGQISNLYNLIEKRDTWIDLRMYSDKTDLLPLIAPKGGQKGNNPWPQHIYLKCGSMIKNLYIKGHNYKDVQSELYYKPGLATLKVFNASIFDGHVKGNAALSLPPKGEMTMAVIAESDNADISQVFMAYNEFGQDFITSNNLKGKLDATMRMNCNITPDFTIDTKSILAHAKVNIKKGELMEHKPMYSLSKYISLDELKHIYFADLSNEIFINNQTIFIPTMKIKSTAMDIEISGRHFFHNRFEYLFNIYVSDLLAKKSKRSNQHGESFTYVQREESKHFKIPLVMRGDTSDFSVELNKKQAREVFAASIEQQKRAVQKALHLELQKMEVEIPETPADVATDDLRFEFQENVHQAEEEKGPGAQDEKKTNSGLRFEFDE